MLYLNDVNSLKTKLIIEFVYTGWWRAVRKQWSPSSARFRCKLSLYNFAPLPPHLHQKRGVHVDRWFFRIIPQQECYLPLCQGPPGEMGAQGSPGAPGAPVSIPESSRLCFMGWVVLVHVCLWGEWTETCTVKDQRWYFTGITGQTRCWGETGHEGWEGKVEMCSLAANQV